MLNANRLSNIIQQVQRSKANIGGERWLDKPYYRGTFQWCKEKIGIRPQNLVAQVLARIDCEIRMEQSNADKHTFNQVTEETYDYWKDMTATDQASRWLGLNRKQGAILFAPQKHQISVLITQDTTLRVLRNLQRTKKVNWRIH